MPLTFKRSERLSIGTEIELQLVDDKHYDLTDRADRVVSAVGDRRRVKHELTKSMVELNSSVHRDLEELHAELRALTHTVRRSAQRLGCDVCGGGRHLSNDWRKQVISDNARYRQLASRFGYLSKLACVFGQHIHLGVNDGNEAMYLCHALTPYFPQLIALSASSPLYQGVDTRFASSRFSAQNSFPNYGCLEHIYSWREFNAYYERLNAAGVIESIKDIYWDARPKPELGTVEIRICDTPLRLAHAVLLVGYCRLLADFLLQHRTPIAPEYDAFTNYNKINAYRSGFAAEYVDPATLRRSSLTAHILHTLDALSGFAERREDRAVLQAIEHHVRQGISDSEHIRQMLHNGLPQAQVIKRLCDELLQPAS
ncbi:MULTISPECIES: YbdK family carboxylate-amine ligase [Serratia]|uniref:YbdK family carboxylate-amine ligase n=1 Tax=Serratia TaxID=613 RepID=UPI0007455917|nr:YbdK family carboxylate-amine ligase [Serratia marcescens]EME1463584.1 glutamate--cysteine ligase [Serratia marcescens]MBN3900281.1 glutamate--cysteine ligase [Serratia marcescens]MBN3912891.1 glutamate--cysteine ligase [Serratia marcescens]MBN3918216.1 glutamate--cysteine ligase [Serratia marcescens]MBN3934159.1 glutamate--cysteine ligase [Serratia marcescens]